MSQSVFGTWPQGQQLVPAWAISPGLGTLFIGTPGVWGPGPTTNPDPSQLRFPFLPGTTFQFPQGTPFLFRAFHVGLVAGVLTPKALAAAPEAGGGAVIVYASAPFEAADTVLLELWRPAGAAVDVIGP